MVVREFKSVVRRTFRRVMWHDQARNDHLLTQLWNDPDGLLTSGTMLKDGDRSTVVRIEGEGVSHVLKRYNLKGSIHTTAHAFLRSRAMWSWRNGLYAHQAGIPTPRPLAALEMRFGPMRGVSFFLCDYVEGITLYDLVRDHNPEPSQIDELARAFSQIWQGLGRHRLTHGDMKATNYIVDQERKIWMLDLDGMRRRTMGLSWKRQREKDRRRFMKNWQDLQEPAAAFLACVDTD